MPDVFDCAVISNERLNDTVFSVAVSCKEIAETARAGQFVGIRCGAERILRRPVSICRAGNGELEFIFEIKGEGTQWLSERIPGQKLDILGPLGNGFDMPDCRTILVGGGIGAPPMLFAAKTAKGPATAILGFRSSDNVILVNEFEEICENVILTTDDGSRGLRGTVAAPLEELLKNGAYKYVAACGPRPMLSAVAAICAQYAVPCQASLEERMGCGIGACAVCVCATQIDAAAQMSRVCKDGPVFDAETVVWTR